MLRRTLLAAAGALSCGLAMFAGARFFSGRPPAELVVPPAGSSAVRIKSAHEAGAVLLPDYFRTIPLSTFGGNTQGLKVGVRLAAQTNSGKQLVGTVVAIGEKDLTMKIDSWESVAPPSR